MPPSRIVEAFSVSHAQVLNGTETFANAAFHENTDVYGVDQASLEPNMGEFDNQGDDVVLSTWDWLNYATVEVRAGYLSFPLIANMTGESVVATGSGNETRYELELWSEASFNVPPKPMLVRMPSKDKDGVVRLLDIGLYKVQFRPITFDGPVYKDGLKVNYVGKALLSDTDEVGDPFASGGRRVGKLISRHVPA